MEEIRGLMDKIKTD